MQTIKRLPESAHSSLRSSVVLSDLPRVVEELIYNSIDANASKIDIAINIRACYVKVEDDGMHLCYLSLCFFLAKKS